MNEPNEALPHPPGDGNPHRALTAAVRFAILPTLGLPAGLAALGASATGQGLSVQLAWPLAALAIVASSVCWWRVVHLWRSLPGHDDDEGGFGRGWDADPPAGPDGGPGSARFDWASFERQFWSHVLERERARELALVSEAGAPAQPSRCRPGR